MGVSYRRPGLTLNSEATLRAGSFNADRGASGLWLAAYFELLRRERSGSMGNVQLIEDAVESPPPVELAEFRRSFAEFDGNAWDRQTEQDAAAGKLDQLAAQALADYRAGSARRL